jgi:branched-chain amino acid transport system substrate-binding protein
MDHVWLGRVVTRRFVLGTATCAPLAARSAEAPAGDPVIVGVSGPLTGQYAQYGADWKRGFDLAMSDVNAAGGIGGLVIWRSSFQDTPVAIRARRWRSRRNSSPIRAL